MKNKGPLVFSVLVIGLVIYAYFFEYRKDVETKEKKEKNSILLALPIDKIQKVELKQGPLTLSLEREKVGSSLSEGWKLVSPVVDLADGAVVSEMLTQISGERSTDEITEVESGSSSGDTSAKTGSQELKWEVYGLKAPKATLSFKTQSGELDSFELGSRKHFEGSSFLRKNQDKKVLVGSSSWNTYAEKTVRDLRDKRAVRQAFEGLTQVKIIQGTSVSAGKGIALTQKEGLWTLEAHPKWALSQNKVRELITAAKDMKALNFISEADPVREQFKTYGLQQPQVTLKLDFKDAAGVLSQTEVVIGQATDKTWYAWPKDLKRVIKIDQSQVDRFLKATEVDLRDTEAPFLFTKSEIQRIQVKGEKEVEFVKEGTKWKALAGEADAAKVEDLLVKVGGLKVSEFIDGKSEAPGTSEAKKKLGSINLIGADGKSVLELVLGSEYKKKQSGTDKTMTYVKSSKYSDVVGVDSSSLSSINLDQILVSEKKGSNESNKN